MLSYGLHFGILGAFGMHMKSCKEGWKGQGQPHTGAERASGHLLSGIFISPLSPFPAALPGSGDSIWMSATWDLRSGVSAAPPSMFLFETLRPSGKG